MKNKKWKNVATNCEKNFMTIRLSPSCAQAFYLQFIFKYLVKKLLSILPCEKYRITRCPFLLQLLPHHSQMIIYYYHMFLLILIEDLAVLCIVWKILWSIQKLHNKNDKFWNSEFMNLRNLLRYVITHSWSPITIIKPYKIKSSN